MCKNLLCVCVCVCACRVRARVKSPQTMFYFKSIASKELLVKVCNTNTRYCRAGICGRRYRKGDNDPSRCNGATGSRRHI